MRIAIAAAVACLSIVGVTATAQVHAAIRKHTEIPPEPLDLALRTLAKDRGFQVVYLTEDVRTLRTRGAICDCTVDEALRKLLSDSRLEYKFVDENTVSIFPQIIPTSALEERNGASASVRSENPSADSPKSSSEQRLRLAQVDQGQTSGPASVSQREQDSKKKSDLEEIVVTGTHIRGAQPAGSQVTVYDRDAIDQSGAATIGDFARTMTENFASLSGTATQYANTPGGFPQNTSNSYSGEGFNLYGLGANSTLTLINGQRITGAGNDGSFVDVSILPLSAIDHIEVLADGGSAIYGADAVAGVVNIILKQDFDGAQTSARYGYPTDGGGQEVTVSQLFGRTWDSGGFMLDYEYDHQDPVLSSQRDFVPQQTEPFDLTAHQSRQSAVFTGHQAIIDDSTQLRGFGYYGDRDLDALWLPNGRLVQEVASVKQYGGSLTLEHTFTNDWRLSLDGTYSKAEQPLTETFQSPTRSENISTDTQLQGLDIQADGGLFSIGHEEVKGAFGAGVRRESLDAENFGFTGLHRTVRDAFGELRVPVVGPDDNIPLVRRLEFSAAGRYDDYSDVGSSTTPKIGALWSPVPALSVRGSYSKSFRPPSLPQLASQPEFFTFPFANPSSPTGTTDTLVDQSAGEPNLRPETATTTTAGLDFQPSSLPNLRVSATYFQINFKDRIAQPPLVGFVFSGGNPFLQPAVSPFLNRSPNPSSIAADFNSPGFFFDLAGGGPTAVKAIFNDQLANIQETDESGIALSSKYRMQSDVGEFVWSLAGTYLLDNKFISAQSVPSQSMLNMIGEPLRFRARTGLNWTLGGLGSSIFLNYSNAYENPLLTPTAGIASWTTIDYQLTYHLSDRFGYTGHSGVYLTLNVQNLFNRDPPFASVPTGFNNIGFDPLNASPLGRIVSLQVVKAW